MAEPRDPSHIYEDPTGREIATLESDYTLSLAMPTYVFKDYQRDYEEGLRFRDGDYYIFSKDSKDGEKESASRIRPASSPVRAGTTTWWRTWTGSNEATCSR